MRMPSTDEQLIARTRAGDQDAYSALVQRYQRVVFAAGLRITGNRDDAEDIAQEAFVRAYFALDRFSPVGGGFPAWLVRIATNLALTRLRQRRETPTESDERIPDPFPGPAEQAEAAERQEIVRQAVCGLPERYQTVVLLRYMREMSYDEIAHELGVPRNTVATWLRRALDRLEGALGPDGPRESDGPRERAPTGDQGRRRRPSGGTRSKLVGSIGAAGRETR